jgi:methylthioribulose-1-phosphate dehydratase
VNLKQIKTLDALAETGRAIHAWGWVPATSGNFSVRLDNDSVAITVSGEDKGRLTRDSFLRVDLQGNTLDAMQDGTPSAETALHLQLYRRDSEIGAVLHTHSLNATLVSIAASGSIHIEGFEILKAFAGIDTHESAIDIPVFPNTQDIGQLASDVEETMRQSGQGVGYLIKGHGLYTWGKDVGEAFRHLETLEYLLEAHRTTMSANHQ